MKRLIAVPVALALVLSGGVSEASAPKPQAYPILSKNVLMPIFVGVEGRPPIPTQQRAEVLARLAEASKWWGDQTRSSINGVMQSHVTFTIAASVNGPDMPGSDSASVLSAVQTAGYSFADPTRIPVVLYPRGSETKPYKVTPPKLDNFDMWYLSPQRRRTSAALLALPVPYAEVLQMKRALGETLGLQRAGSLRTPDPKNLDARRDGVDPKDPKFLAVDNNLDIMGTGSKLSSATRAVLQAHKLGHRIFEAPINHIFTVPYDGSGVHWIASTGPGRFYDELYLEDSPKGPVFSRYQISFVDSTVGWKTESYALRTGIDSSPVLRVGTTYNVDGFTMKILPGLKVRLAPIPPHISGVVK